MSINLVNRKRAFVIAEAGTCHFAESIGERIGLANKHVKAAAEAGADAIKFQIFDDPNPETMFCWIDGDENRVDRWKGSRLGIAQWMYVKRYAEDLGITFLASVFENTTVSWLNKLKVDAYKVASRAAKNFPYKKVPGPFLIANGMHNLFNVTLDPDTYCIMQCEARYPSITRWKGHSSQPGFSDHSANQWYAIDAMFRGCKMVEVHFKIDDEYAGPDLPASLTVDQLRLICEARDAITKLPHIYALSEIPFA